MAPTKNSLASRAIKSFVSSRKTRSMVSPVKLTKFTPVSSPPSTTPSVVPATRRSPRLSSHGSPQLRRSPHLSSYQPPAEKMPSPPSITPSVVPATRRSPRLSSHGSPQLRRSPRLSSHQPPAEKKASPSVVPERRRRKLKPKIQMSHTWKCLIVGNGGVGKSTFIKKVMGDPFGRKYKRTKSNEKFKFVPITFSSTRGWLTFEVYDTVGQEGSSVLHKKVYAERDCGIIMFDLMNEVTYAKKVKWYGGLKYNFPERAAKGRLCSMVLVGTKDDLEGPQKLNADGIRKHHGLPMEFVNISSVSNQNLHHPFLMLARDLLGDKNLEFLRVGSSHKKLVERQWCNVGILDIPE